MTVAFAIVSPATKFWREVIVTVVPGPTRTSPCPAAPTTVTLATIADATPGGMAPLHGSLFAPSGIEMLYVRSSPVLNAGGPYPVGKPRLTRVSTRRHGTMF